MQVEVCYAEASRAWRVDVRLPVGATVAQALAAADMASRVPGITIDPARLAIFGRAAAPHDVLVAGDRVEILRPLVADPKQARRERAARADRTGQVPGGR